MSLILLNTQPLGQNPVNYAYLDDVSESIICMDADNITQLFLIQGGNLKRTIIAPALNAASLSGATYTALKTGQKVIVDNYNATGDACVIEKSSVANADVNDWKVRSTVNTASTGAIGDTPI